MTWLALIPAAWKRWLALGAGALVTAAVLIAQARTNARLRAERKADKRRIETMQEARDVQRSVSAASRADRERRLARWMRDE